MTPRDKAYLTRVAVNTYDFCGNMAEAVREAAHDDDIEMTEGDLVDILVDAKITIRAEGAN